MKLKKIYETVGQSYGFPALPSPANSHHFNKHPKNSKGRQWYAHSSGDESFPFPDPEGDEKFNVDDGEGKGDVEGLPENLSLKELFKFTMSANDNTSFHRPPTYGAGPPAAYGKSSDEFGNYTKEKEDDDEKDLKRKTSAFEDRMDVRVKRVNETFGPGMRTRHTNIGPENMVTFFPWTQGMKNKHHSAVEEFDELEGKQEIEDYLNGDIEDYSNNMTVREVLFNENPQFTKYADTAYSRRNQSRKQASKKEDLEFFDRAEKENPYMMNDEDDIKNRNKMRFK